MRQRLRFQDCDPAGIAYYPRYFALADGVIEEWTEAVLGVTRRRLHFELDWGLPTVSLQADFAAVSRLGDWLDFALQVTDISRSSVGLAIEARCNGERRFGVRYKQVLVDMATMTSKPWPDDWRQRLETTL
jgi:4-hydroxybenzoyl-CoA thioesterase